MGVLQSRLTSGLLAWEGLAAWRVGLFDGAGLGEVTNLVAGAVGGQFGQLLCALHTLQILLQPWQLRASSAGLDHLSRRNCTLVTGRRVGTSNGRLSWLVESGH